MSKSKSEYSQLQYRSKVSYHVLSCETHLISCETHPVSLETCFVSHERPSENCKYKVVHGIKDSGLAYHIESLKCVWHRGLDLLRILSKAR